MQKTAKKRKRYSRDFKLSIMRELATGRPASELARLYDIDEGQISKWSKEYREAPHDAFMGKKKKTTDAAQIAHLERIIGRLHVENDILKKASLLIEEKLVDIRKARIEKS